MYKNIIKQLREHSNRKQAKNYARFFKTGKGEYGEGDIFWGIRVPDIRKIAKNHIDISFSDIRKLLNSKVHEHRFCGIILLVYKYANIKSNKCKNYSKKLEIVDFYLQNTKQINNRDLVDVSAHKILGQFILDSHKCKGINKTINLLEILDQLVVSTNLRERRIAIVSTFQLIKDGYYDLTLTYSKILLNDNHDLIHKAVGRMLREVGKRDFEIEESFLQKHYQYMTRTTLRYAIERFPKDLRLKYIN